MLQYYFQMGKYSIQKTKLYALETVVNTLFNALRKFPLNSGIIQMYLSHVSISALNTKLHQMIFFLFYSKHVLTSFSIHLE